MKAYQQPGFHKPYTVKKSFSLFFLQYKVHVGEQKHVLYRFSNIENILGSNL